MHKTLSGKTEWAKHTRNTAWGKRGVSKRERRVPLPDEDQPAVVSTRKRRKVRKPFMLEWRFKMGERWRAWGVYRSYETAEQRDQAMAKLAGKSREWLQFRIAPETPKAAPSGTASTVNQTEVSAS